eukprot:CFRG8681
MSGNPSSTNMYPPASSTTEKKNAAYPPPYPSNEPADASREGAHHAYGQQAQPQFQYQHEYMPPPTSSYVQQQPVPVIMKIKPSFSSQSLHCPVCQTNVTTKTEYNSGLLAWGGAAVCCLVGCWLGCCLIPLMIKDCKDVTHVCPKCKTVLAQRKRLS